MNKKDWKEALKEMERLHGVAVKNVEAAENQKEELEFNIENYKKKIELMK
jgi:hypothetical protein